MRGAISDGRPYRDPLILLLQSEVMRRATLATPRLRCSQISSHNSVRIKHVAVSPGPARGRVHPDHGMQREGSKNTPLALLGR